MLKTDAQLLITMKMPFVIEIIYYVPDPLPIQAFYDITRLDSKPVSGTSYQYLSNLE